MSWTVWGALRRGELSMASSPRSMAAISWRMAIMASPKRSISALDSDSGGSALGGAGGGGVEARVDEALGEVVDGDAGGVLEGAGVEDALVGDATVVVLVEHGEVRGEGLRDVVGVEDGGLGGACEALAAHQQEVGVGDGEDRRGAVGCGRDGADRRGAVELGVAGKEGREVGADADGTDAGATAAVGDAEGLVQVEVADVGAELARVDEADLGVEVGSVEVDLATGGVDDLADLADLLFEDAVGGGVGDHDAGEDVGVLGGLLT